MTVSSKRTFFKARDFICACRAEQGFGVENPQALHLQKDDQDFQPRIATPCPPQYAKYFEKFIFAHQQKADLQCLF